MFRSLKAAAGMAASFAGGAVRSVWSRIGGTGFGSRLRFLLPGSRFDYEREAGDLWSNSSIAIGLKWIGDNYPRPRLKVSKLLSDGSELEVPFHPLVKLLRRPNPYQTGRALAKAIVLSLVCDGNGYLIKVRNGLKQPVQLYWVPHWLIQPCWPADGSVFISHYEYLRDYDIQRIDPADVVHFRDGIDPRNDRLGIAPLKAQLREICTDNEVSGYTASIMRNAGVPGLYARPVKPDATINGPAAERIKAVIKDTLTGDDRGETMVFNQQVELVTLGFSPEQLRLDRLPALAQAKILAAMGLSMMSANLPDANKTYSNYREANTAAWRQCLVPIQDTVAETFHWSLLPEFDNPDSYLVHFDYTHVEALQEDLNMKHDRVRADWVAGLATHAEACGTLGYEVDQADGDRYYPGTVDAAPGGPELAGPEPADDDAPADDDDEADDLADDGTKTKATWSY